MRYAPKASPGTCIADVQKDNIRIFLTVRVTQAHNVSNVRALLIQKVEVVVVFTTKKKKNFPYQWGHFPSESHTPTFVFQRLSFVWPHTTLTEDFKSHILEMANYSTDDCYAIQCLKNSTALSAQAVTLKKFPD